MKRLTFLIMTMLLTTMVSAQVPEKPEHRPVHFLDYIAVDSGIKMTPREVTQGNFDTLSGWTPTGDTFEEIFWEVFAPSGFPLCNITRTGGEATYEYQNLGSVTVDLSFYVNKNTNPASDPLITVAQVVCNQAVAGFPLDFHDAVPANNQSGTTSGTILVNNVTNTFTTQGTSGDGKTCTSSTSIYFKDQRYWGVDANGVVLDAEILAFETAGDSDFANGGSTAGTAYTFLTISDEYVVIVIPNTQTQPTEAQIGAFRTDITSYFSLDGSFSLTTTSGAVRVYTVYTSINKYTDTSLLVTLFY